MSLVACNTYCADIDSARLVGLHRWCGEERRGFADAIGVDFKKLSMDSGVDPTTVESKVSACLR
jgi:hypothetical protein